MNNIPFGEMCAYYHEIITNIYNEIREKYPNKYKDLCRIEYSDEYLQAYGWLQRAGWRLSETTSMSEHYNEPLFKYYGLENLSNVKHRIEGYLESTDFKFTDKVTEYHKYDEILKERFELIKDPNFHKYYKYYSKLHSQEQNIEHIELDKHWLISQLESFKNTIKESEHIINKDALEETLSSMHKTINELNIHYMEIKPPEKEE